jgi:subfamily B ATP-binding cassette protein MsbA
LIHLIVELPRTFTTHFRAFRKYAGNHIFVLIALSVVMSWAEGIGLALFFPLLGGEQANDPLSRGFGSVLDFLHLERTPASVLPIIVLVFVFKGGFMFATSSYQAWLAARIPLRLRKDIIASLRRSNYNTIVGTNAGFVSNLLVSEVYKVEAGFLAFARTFAPALNIIVFFSIVIWLDWRLTAMCVLMGVCVVVLIGITGRISARASRALTKEHTLLSSLLIQMVQAFKYLRATGGFGAFEQKIGGSAERAARAEFKNYSAAALSQSVSQPLMVLLLAAIIYYQAVLNSQPIGSLLVLLLYFFRIMTELWTLQYNWQSFIAYLGGIELVYETSAKYTTDVEQTGSRPFEPVKSEISLRDVSFSYVPGREVLRDISLKIPKNSTVAFVGESGSGKSTLVDLIMGTLKPSAGSVDYDGVPLTDIDLETLRRQVGYVPQDAMLFDDTVGNNISLWQPTTETDIRGAAARAKCVEFIEAMPERYDAKIGDRGIKLSGGQRQRIAIARELFKHPSILVLDEATSALDTESERAIQNSIDSLKGQMTILIIAHRLSTIRNCEHVCVLHEGRIVESGSYDELIAKAGSRFQRLCQLQDLEREFAPAAS